MRSGLELGPVKSPEEVLNAVRIRYRRQWRDWLCGDPPTGMSWPLDAPSADTVYRDSAEVNAWLRTWTEWAGTHPGTALRARQVRTRTGDETVFSHLDVFWHDGLHSLAPDLSGHWRVASARARALQEISVSPEEVRPWLSQIVDLDDADFVVLVNAARWFATNRNSGYTVRQVPVSGMHTKWLAQHRRLVLALLGAPHRDSVATEARGVARSGRSRTRSTKTPWTDSACDLSRPAST